MSTVRSSDIERSADCLPLVVFRSDCAYAVPAQRFRFACGEVRRLPERSTATPRSFAAGGGGAESNWKRTVGESKLHQRPRGPAVTGDTLNTIINLNQKGF